MNRGTQVQARDERRSYGNEETIRPGLEPRQQAKVVILDDEECALELASLFLRNEGHSTIQCTSAHSAMTHFAQDPETVDLLVADVTLADGSGVETAVKLKESRPELKLLFVSGYPVDRWSFRDTALLKLLPKNSVRVLQKPFSGRELIRNTDELMGSPSDVRTVSAPQRVASEPHHTDTLSRQAELLELAHDAILVHDEEGKVRFWNGGAEALYGWPKDRAAGCPAHDLLRTVFPVPFSAIERELTETGRWEGELQQSRRNGDVVIVSSRWAVRRDPEGRKEILEINRDITARRQVEEGFCALNRELGLRVEELRRAEQRFRGLLEAAPDAMVIVNGDGVISLVNAQTEAMFGYTRGELLGKNVDMLLPQSLRSRHAAHREQYTGKPHLRPMGQALDLVAVRKNGKEFPVEIALSPIETQSGLLISSSIRDVSERKRLEAAVSEKNSDRKNSRVTDKGQNCLGLLQAIIGFADLLAEQVPGALNEAQKRYVAIILNDSQELLSLINDGADSKAFRVAG